MPALSRRQSLPAVVPHSRAEILNLVSEGAAGNMLLPDGDGLGSPALALQQRLLRAYVEAPARAVRDDRLPLPLRGAIIIGVAASLWFAIGGAILLAIAFL